MKDYATVLHWLHEFPDWYARRGTQKIPVLVCRDDAYVENLNRACVFLLCVYVHVWQPPAHTMYARMLPSLLFTPYSQSRSLVCRFLPAAPSPPGEAATRAAAIAEGATDNGDEAVATARRDGVIPAIESS